MRHDQPDTTKSDINQAEGGGERGQRRNTHLDAGAQAFRGGESLVSSTSDRIDASHASLSNEATSSSAVAAPLSNEGTYGSTVTALSSGCIPSSRSTAPTGTGSAACGDNLSAMAFACVSLLGAQRREERWLQNAK